MASCNFWFPVLLCTTIYLQVNEIIAVEGTTWNHIIKARTYMLIGVLPQNPTIPRSLISGNTRMYIQHPIEIWI